MNPRSVGAPSPAFLRASATGAGLAAALYSWLLTAGTFDLLRWQRIGDFYDAQAHSLLHGRLAVDPAVLGPEAFHVGGGSYMYQGPVPALLRLPVVLLAGERLDGRLTQLSMLLGLALALWATTRLHWYAREAVRGAGAVSRGEWLAVAAFTFLVGGGSALLYQASRAWVFHEAIVWGVAFSLLALERLARVGRDGHGLAAASACTALALLSRASVGLGPLVALALVVGSVQWRGRGARPPDLRRLAGGTAAVVGPVVAYVLVNHAKFGSLVSVPFGKQGFAQIDPGHRAFLDTNGGTFFGLRFVPTTVLHYLRPDGLRLTGSFPFVEFPSVPGPIVGGAVFDLVDRAASLPASMPALTLLAVFGVLVLARAARRRDPSRQALGLLCIGAAAGALTILPFGYIAHRYLGDTVPLLCLAGAVGLQGLLRAAARRSRPPALTGLLAVGCALAVAGSAWVNVGLALRYQRAWSADIAPELVAGFLDVQADVADALGRPGPAVEVGTALPTDQAPAGSLFVAGDCDALYLADGLPSNAVKRSQWNPVEGTERAGWYDLEVSFPALDPGSRVPILSTSGGDLVVVEYLADGKLRLSRWRADGSQNPGRELHVTLGRTHRVRVLADGHLGRLTLRLGDRVVLDDFIDRGTTAVTIGASDGRPGLPAVFPGRIDARALDAPLCRRLLAGVG